MIAAIVILIIIILMAYCAYSCYQEGKISFPNNWTRCNAGRGETYCYNTPESEQVIITVRSLSEGGIPLVTAKQLLEKQIDEEKNHMIEKNVTLQEFDGKTGHGYYFQATDTTVKSGEWPYLLRCMYVCKSSSIEVTVLCFGQDSQAIKHVFRVLKNT